MKKTAKSYLFFLAGHFTALAISLFWNSFSDIVSNYLDYYLFILVLIFIFMSLDIFYVKNRKYYSTHNTKYTFSENFEKKYDFYFGLGFTIFVSLLRTYVF